MFGACPLTVLSEKHRVPEYGWLTADRLLTRHEVGLFSLMCADVPSGTITPVYMMPAVGFTLSSVSLTLRHVKALHDELHWHPSVVPDLLIITFHISGGLRLQSGSLQTSAAAASRRVPKIMWNTPNVASEKWSSRAAEAVTPRCLTCT